MRRKIALFAATVGLLFAQAGKAEEQAVLEELRTAHQGWTLDGHFFVPSTRNVERPAQPVTGAMTIPSGELVWRVDSPKSSEEEIKRFVLPVQHGCEVPTVF